MGKPYTAIVHGWRVAFHSLNSSMKCDQRIMHGAEYTFLHRRTRLIYTAWLR